MASQIRRVIATASGQSTTTSFSSNSETESTPSSASLKDCLISESTAAGVDSTPTPLAGVESSAGFAI